MAKVAVIGSGISGLTAAYRLQQAGHKVTVMEAGTRAGGAIHTIRTGQEVMDTGPDSLLASKPQAIELAKELDVPLVESQAQGPPGVVHKERLLPLPDGFRLLAPTRLLPFALTPLLSLRGKARALAELLLPPQSQMEEDESVANFVERRFGKEILDTLAQPLIGGIYAADPEKLSLQSTFPFLRALEKSRGSVIRGFLAAAGSKGPKKSLFWAPKGGMSDLIEALLARIGTEHLRLSSPVLQASRDKERWVLRLSDREEGFDGLLLACPAHRAAQILSEEIPSVAEQLDGIPYTSTATVHLVFDKSQIGRQLTGSGFVVPHTEGLDITACTYCHQKYPGRAGTETALLRVHLGGALNPKVLEKPDLDQRALDSIRPILDISGEAQHSHVTHHHQVMPQYQVGHLKRRERLQHLMAHHSTLALCGNGLHGVGLPDCVKRATEGAKQLHQAISF